LKLTGGGAFYSQTPKSCLEDIGVNKGVNKGSFSKGAGAKHLRILKSDVILNEVKNRRNEQTCSTQRFFKQSSQNDKLDYPRSVGERVPKAGEGLREKEILRPSAEVVSATSTTKAQNDIRVNVISEQSYSSEARVSSRLEKETEINKKLDSRTQGFENDVLDYPRSVGERVPKAGEGLREKEILRPSAEVLSATSTTKAQNDILDFPLLGRGLGRGFEEENDILRSSAEILNELSMTNAQNDMVVGINIPRVVIMNLFQNLQIKQISTIQRFFGLRPQNDKGVNNKPKHVILSKNCAEEEQSKNFGEGSRNRIKNFCFWLGKDRTLTPIPSPNGRGVKKPAFTLAEVLITLGVVGVIAAMTLPMLAENYQRRIVETRLKRFYTTFNQAILRSIDVNGPYDGWAYTISEKKDENGNMIYGRFEEIENSFNLYLRPYLNIIYIQDVLYTNNSRTYLYYLADGSAFSYPTSFNRDVHYYPKDPVKCLQQPAINRMGVCQFQFFFCPACANSASLKYHYNKGLEPYKFGWSGNPTQLYEKSNGYGCGETQEYGMYCTALIQYNNWQFPKDYPRKIRY